MKFYFRSICVFFFLLYQIVPSDVRSECFPYVLNGLLDTENERNWRYRNLLAE